MANIRGAIELVLLPPGRHAAQVRRQAASLLVRYLVGDIVDEVYDPSCQNWCYLSFVISVFKLLTSVVSFFLSHVSVSIRFCCSHFDFKLLTSKFATMFVFISVFKLLTYVVSFLFFFCSHVSVSILLLFPFRFQVVDVQVRDHFLFTFLISFQFCFLKFSFATKHFAFK